MNKLSLVGQIKQKSAVGTLVPKTFKKYSRDPNAKFFAEQYKKASDEHDRNLISLVNAMVTSNRPVTILTRKIFEDIVAADKNWKPERKLNTKQYTVFIKALKNLDIFQIVHEYTQTAPMILRIVHPELRAMMDISAEDEHKLLIQCEEFRSKRDSTQKNTPAPEVAPVIERPKPNPASINNLNKAAEILRAEEKFLPEQDSWFNEPAKGISKATPSKVIYEADGEEFERNIDDLRAEMMKEECTTLGLPSPYEDLLDEDPEIDKLGSLDS